MRWSRILASRGHDISVITNERVEGSWPHGKLIECLSRRYRLHILKLAHELLRAVRIRMILHSVKPDVVHIHSFDYIHPLMIGLVSSLSKGFRNLVVSTWGTDVIGRDDASRSRRGEFAKRVLLRQAKRITATTRFLAKETAQLSPPNRAIQVIPFGIDCEMFCRRSHRPPKGRITLGFIKHLKPKYGPDYLLKAMAIVANRFDSVSLVMVGGGEMDSYLRRLASELKIERNVRFVGYVPYCEVPEILAGLDIFVMPSISEAFGVAAIEAQAMRVPVVASNIGGVPEAVVDGVTGILVEPKDVAGMADAISKLIKDDELRRKYGENGRRFVLENYDINRNVLVLERLYTSMTTEGRMV